MFKPKKSEFFRRYKIFFGTRKDLGRISFFRKSCCLGQKYKNRSFSRKKNLSSGNPQNGLKRQLASCWLFGRNLLKRERFPPSLLIAFINYWPLIGLSRAAARVTESSTDDSVLVHFYSSEKQNENKSSAFKINEMKK